MTTFYPRGAILAGLLVVIVYPSACVCLSVCPSVCHKPAMYQNG